MIEGLRIFKARRYVDATFLRMALEIQKYELKNLCFITILKGGVYTAFNVFRYLRRPSEEEAVFGYVGLSSYREFRASSGEIKVTYSYDLDKDMIEGRNVWVIDDICDTGETLDYAKGLIEAYHPESFRTAVLVDKKNNRENNHSPEPDVVGFVYEGTEFLVGCGMGLGEKYRCLRELYVLEVEK